MAKLYNLARMSTATTGTGTITLGSAVAPFLSFSGAGIADGDIISYSIIDGTANSEIGTGTYTAAGTTLTRNVTKSTNANAAISLSGSAQVIITARAEDIGGIPACGRLAYSSATAITFKPYNGDKIKINGSVYPIPSAGITGGANTSVFVGGVGASNLAASTLYYVYAFLNSGTITFDFSTTAHAVSSTSGNIGTEIKSGDDTRTLIGMVYTNASSQFDDSDTKRNVASWFNRQGRRGKNAFTAARTTASTTYVELNTEIRIEFTAFTDEVQTVSLNGMASISATGFGFTSVGFDGTTAEDITAFYSNTSAIEYQAGYTMTKNGLADGHHYVTLLAKVSAATGTWGDVSGTVVSMNMVTR